MRYLFLILLIYSCNPSNLELKSTIDLNKYVHPKEPIYTSSIEIIDTLEAKKLGEMLWHKRTGIARTSCNDCHNVIINSGYAIEASHQGGGYFKKKYAENLKRWGWDFKNVPIDEQINKRSPTILNSYKRTERILSKGFKSEHPLEFQVFKASEENLMGAHFMSDLSLECRHDYFIMKMSDKAFNRVLDKKVVAASLSIFEQSLTTSENGINKYIRGESDFNYRSIKGFELYDKLCYDCHNVSNKMGLSIKGDSVLIPPLENSRDAPCYFDDCKVITQYKAIKAHNDIYLKESLSRGQINDIKRFINKMLYDARY